jgi:hypothetical protein
VLVRTDDRFEWIADGTVVAGASLVHGLWQVVDARNEPVVTLMPLGSIPDTDRPGLALVGPNARLLGTVHLADDDDGGRTETSARDEQGRPLLVLHRDPLTGCHILDCAGEVVAVATWRTKELVTDLVVTPRGTRQPLATVFGLVLATELDRHSGRSTS